MSRAMAPISTLSMSTITRPATKMLGYKNAPFHGDIQRDTTNKYQQYDLSLSNNGKLMEMKHHSKAIQKRREKKSPGTLAARAHTTTELQIPALMTSRTDVVADLAKISRSENGRAAGSRFNRNLGFRC